MSVTIDPKGPIKIGPPVQVLANVYYGGITALSRTGTYDVASDGRRFLMLKDVDDANAVRRTQIVVDRGLEAALAGTTVIDWFWLGGSKSALKSR